MNKKLTPTVEASLKARSQDTWLTCLKFLIPFYPLLYAFDRRTVTHLISGFIGSIFLTLLVYATDQRAGIDTSAPDYNDVGTGLAYFASPITMGVGAMKAKRYARRRLKNSLTGEDE